MKCCNQAKREGTREQGRKAKKRARTRAKRRWTRRFQGDKPYRRRGPRKLGVSEFYGQSHDLISSPLVAEEMVGTTRALPPERTSPIELALILTRLPPLSPLTSLHPPPFLSLLSSTPWVSLFLSSLYLISLADVHTLGLQIIRTEWAASSEEVGQQERQKRTWTEGRDSGSSHWRRSTSQRSAHVSPSKVCCRGSRRTRKGDVEAHNLLLPSFFPSRSVGSLHPPNPSRNARMPSLPYSAHERGIVPCSHPGQEAPDQLGEASGEGRQGGTAHDHYASEQRGSEEDIHKDRKTRYVHVGSPGLRLRADGRARKRTRGRRR